MKQIWTPYWEWEDWLNGMWGTSLTPELHLQQAIEFTGDHVKYGQAMAAVVTAWPRTMLNSLTNPSINKRAFVGHCAVSLALGIPEYITRQAWRELTEEQRQAADAVAQKTIDEWKEKYQHGLKSGSGVAIVQDCLMKAR